MGLEVAPRAPAWGLWQTACGAGSAALAWPGSVLQVGAPLVCHGAHLQLHTRTLGQGYIVNHNTGKVIACSYACKGLCNRNR